jgi:hypothetical protein
MTLRILIGAVWLAATLAQAANPSYPEVRELLLKHLDGVTETAVDDAAVAGLLNRFAGQATLLTNGAGRTETESTNLPAIAAASVFDDGYGYVRLGRLTEDATGQFKEKLAGLVASNQLKGLLLDLRFASGSDPAAAAGIAGLLVGSGKPLMEWKGQKFTAPAAAPAVNLPLAILVNRQTRGAPEVLAAILQEQKLAAVIGSATRGETAEYQDFKLAGGHSLRLATVAIRLGAGQPIPAGGIRPDILITVPEREERAYLQNPFQAGGDDGLENAARPRLTEADLVRRKREESNPDGPAKPHTAPRWPPAKPLVHDPALARGLDLLKGLNLMKIRQGS